MTDVAYHFKRGDDFVIPMTLQDSDQNPVDITGWTISSAVTYARKPISTLDCTITEWADNPDTSSPWDTADLAALIAGVEAVA